SGAWVRENAILQAHSCRSALLWGWRGACTREDCRRRPWALGGHSSDWRREMRLLLVGLLAVTPLLAQDKEPAERLHEAAAVFSEIMAATDTSIPQDLLTDAHCIVIVAELKPAAFVFGAKYGKGYLSCRTTA